MLEWLVRLLTLRFDMGVVPMDWVEGKGEKSECSTSRGISLFNAVDTLFIRVLTKKVRVGPELNVQ